MNETSARNIVVTTDRSRLDLDVIHGFLTTSYWARGIPRETVAQSMEHSLCFGALDEGRQVGFARVISDRATFAYICDVFASSRTGGRSGQEPHGRHHGPPELQGLRRWTLFTRDAQGLYRKFGFGPASHPERLMEVVDRDPYRG
jgi:hypothetical protein